jgi:glyoxylase-like metal-dependent hydrolase (beta-lactamase superfamily II)
MWTSDQNSSHPAPRLTLQAQTNESHFTRRRTARIASTTRRAQGPAACLVTRHLPLATVVLLASSFWLLTSAPSLQAAAWRYQVIEVKPHVFVWVPEDIRDQEADPEYDRAGTAGFIITDQGVIVVNTSNSPFHAREILYEIRKRTDLPVKVVINTDAEPDHFLGNEVFADLQATLISTADAQSEMRRYSLELAKRLDGDSDLQDAMRSFHPTLATEIIKDDWTLHLGGRELKLTAVAASPAAGSGPPALQSSGRGAPQGNAGPTPGMAVVYLPDAKVLFLGDLYENGLIPRLDSADLKGWIQFLKKAEDRDVDVYVPGHGLPGGKRELAEFRRFLEFLSSRPEPKPREPAPHPRWRG